MNTVTFLERHTNATIVGEPTLSDPNFVGESNLVTLPHTRAVVSISDLYWQSSWPMDRRVWVAPTLYVPFTRADYTIKRDAALDAILKFGIRPQ
jgi:hypothetical protein